MINLCTLETIIHQQNLLSKYHLDKIGVFGSILHSENPNDIDILISDYTDYKELLNFKDELEGLAGKYVDIVIEKFADPIVLYRAKKELKICYVM